uniref:D-aminoacyl-tRNA deacylase n=1 Tax=Ascaris suum TaxID=6253 RepID=F1LF78_ASCSU
MRAVVQRVTKAAVLVDEHLVSSIGRGICVLIGINRDDNDADAEYIARKLLNIRLFVNDDTGKRWDKSVKDLNLEILCVSQFTLFGCLKGNKLDFHRSMGPEESPEFYERFIQRLKEAYVADRIKDGKFGAYMNVQIENDGPVTVLLDSKDKDL